MKLFVVTGPSGAGKGTLIKRLIERRADLEVAISATTRPQRPGRRTGATTTSSRRRSSSRGSTRASSSSTSVYVSGQRYGTLRSEVERIHAAGKAVVLELEIEGARAVATPSPPR